MEIFKEWFFWQESDLFFLGIGLVLLSALLPWKKDRNNYLVIAFCILVYILSEITVDYPKTDMLGAIIAIFGGGIGLSVAFGRIIRCIFVKLKKK